jgi:hypothetical protein
MASGLIQRALLAFRAGLQFGGKRDLYEIFGYELRPKFEDYLGKYARQDIAGRIVDAPAQAVWRNPPEIVASTEFKSAWDTLVKKNNIWYYLERTDRLAGIGLYSTMLVGFDDLGALDQPVSGAKEILYLQPYGQTSADVLSFEDNSKSPRYNLPDMYMLKVADPAHLLGITGTTASKTPSRKDVRVHHSRILHVAESILEDEVIGIPRLQRVYNLLDDLIKVVGGGSEMFWLNARQGMQLDIDKEMDLSVPDSQALADEVEEFQHQVRRFIRTRGVTMKNLGTSVADPRGQFEVIMALISGATGIPRRILLGSEAGQLASEQDRANWADRVDERRGSFAEPNILEPFIDVLHAAGILPQGSADVEFVWPSAFHMSPLEAAQTSAQSARSVANLAKQGTKSNPMVITTIEEARVIAGLPAKGAPSQLGASVGDGDGDDDELDEDAKEELGEQQTDQVETTGNVRQLG